MGEYADFNGQRIKIGTCESMYYLRADQRHLVSGGDLAHVGADKYWQAVRFRFPFPDEDSIAPGNFDDFDRALTIRDMPAPVDVNHGIRQFTTDGYNVCLPCPESGHVISSDDGSVIKVNRNAYPGAVALDQQRLLADGRLVGVFRCLGCGAKWRCETLAEVAPALSALAAEVERAVPVRKFGEPAEIPESTPRGIVAERLADGYGLSPVDAETDDAGINRGEEWTVTLDTPRGREQIAIRASSRESARVSALAAWAAQQ